MSVKQIEGYTIYLEQVLGRGSYGKVYRGMDERGKRLVAIKVIPRENIDCNEYLAAALRNEIRIMQTVRGENIVGFVDVMESAKNYYIVQQLCDGDLSQIIRFGECMPEEFCVDVLKQICAGFLALVREGVIHRDLKPANILRKGTKYKLGDFGFAKQLGFGYGVGWQREQEMKLKTTVGTPLYMSIEILMEMHYTSKCDIWALGIIFYEMLHGVTPWRAARQFELARNIQTKPLVIDRKDLGQNTVDFLERCLKLYEKDRIEWNEIFVHPIFKGFFQQFADENKEFQDFRKGIMTNLRFYCEVNQDKLQQYILAKCIGQSQLLTFRNIFELLKTGHPEISQEEVKVIFMKTEGEWHNEYVAFDDLVQILRRYDIELSPSILNKSRGKLNLNKITSQCIDIEDKELNREQHKVNGKGNSEKMQQPKINVQQNNSKGEEIDWQAIQQKIQRFFDRLYRMCVKNGLTLQRVFRDFDKGRKGYLIYPEFKSFLQKVCKEVSDQESLTAFRTISEGDKLEFKRLQRLYLLTNGLEDGSINGE